MQAINWVETTRYDIVSRDIAADKAKLKDEKQDGLDKTELSQVS